MLAEQNHFVHEAAVTMRELTADEKIRLQCEARERYELDQRSTFASGKRTQRIIDDAIIAEKDAALAEKDKEINDLRKLLKQSNNSTK